MPFEGLYPGPWIERGPLWSYRLDSFYFPFASSSDYRIYRPYDNPRLAEPGISNDSVSNPTNSDNQFFWLLGGQTYYAGNPVTTIFQPALMLDFTEYINGGSAQSDAMPANTLQGVVWPGGNAAQYEIDAVPGEAGIFYDQLRFETYMTPIGGSDINLSYPSPLQIQHRRLLTSDYDVVSDPSFGYNNAIKANKWLFPSDLAARELLETINLPAYFSGTQREYSTFDISVYDLDPNNRLALTTAPSWYINGPDGPQPQHGYHGGRTYISFYYKPARYRWWYTTPLTVPPMRQRHRDDGLGIDAKQQKGDGSSQQSSIRRGGRVYY